MQKFICKTCEGNCELTVNTLYVEDDTYPLFCPLAKIDAEWEYASQQSDTVDAESECICEYPYFNVPGCPKHNPSKLVPHRCDHYFGS